MINDALLTKCDSLQQSADYWREKEDQAWATARKWRDEEEAKRADVSQDLHDLCVAIEEIGGMIRFSDGGNMQRHPCDAILYQVKIMFAQHAPKHETEPHPPCGL